MDYATREMFVDILRKRLIEERRNQIATNFRKAKVEMKSGKFKPMTVTEAIKFLNN